MAKPAQCFHFPLIPRLLEGRENIGASKTSLILTLRIREDDKQLRLCVLVDLEERVWEGEQADGWHLINFSSAFESFSPFSWSLPSLPLNPFSPTSYSHHESPHHLQHSFPCPISLSSFEVVRVYQTTPVIQMGIWFGFVQLNVTENWTKKPHTGLVPQSQTLTCIFWFQILHLN